MSYLLLKAAHVLAVITFAGGLLMLSVCVRIANLTVHRAVRRWDRAVTAPALAFVWITGIALALHGHWFGNAWLSAKLVVVVGLSALHGMLAGTLRRMARDDLVVVPKPWLGQAGGAVVIATGIVVGLVVVKPF